MKNMKVEYLGAAGEYEVENGVKLLAGDPGSSKHLGGYEPAFVYTAFCDVRVASHCLSSWNIWPGQRPIDRQRVEEYARRMARELWHHTVISIALIVDGAGKPLMRQDQPEIQQAIMLNGQHTLRSIIKSEGGIWLTFEFYRLTMQQLEMIFTQFDDHLLKKRADALGPMALTYGTVQRKKKGMMVDCPRIDPQTLEVIANAVHWVDHGRLAPRRQRPPKEMLVSVLRAERTRQFVEWLVAAHPDDCRLFRTPRPSNTNRIWHSTSWVWKLGPVAAYYALWQWSQDPQNAQDFLRSVLAHLRNNDPEAGVTIDELIGCLSTPHQSPQTGDDWRGFVASRQLQLVVDAYDQWLKSGAKSVGYKPPFAVVRMMTEKELPLLAQLGGCPRDLVATSADHTPGSLSQDGTLDQRQGLA